MARRLVTLVLTPLLLLGLSGRGIAAEKVKGTPRQPGATVVLPPPEPLTAAARLALRPLMRRHGDELNELVRAVILLRYDQVEELAGKLAAGEQLSRTGEAGTVNAAIPEKFFTRQTELQVRAGELAVAAKARNPAALGSAFAFVSSSCVACHAAHVGSPVDGH